ncbi:(2Fe-2S)-binding protein [Dactylosporangium sp. NPDC000244]|uniref:(2Fe-2S)-binding protein n=1 Tax=Dactylosporangium sp. NPDC000244 TaxID=3154365 RepID=UPI00332BF081
MYVCICHRVRECEIRRVIQSGAHTEDAVGDECGAGTGCGTCLDRIADLIDAESPTPVPVFH